VIVISFYTGPTYKVGAEAMAASAERVGLRVKLYARPDLGSWWKNCNQKCQVVKEALQEFGGEPVLYQDADTRFVAYPRELDGLDSDFAAYFLVPGIPSGGTLWFNGRRAIPIVDAWVNRVSVRPEHEDDSQNFRDALRSVLGLRIQHLPPAYNWHEASMRRSFPGATPVIEHLFLGAHDYPVE
jgi:hypothetical protein